MVRDEGGKFAGIAFPIAKAEIIAVFMVNQLGTTNYSHFMPIIGSYAECIQ